ncbi:hypothetical protein [Cellulomonas cellasea]|uniref:Uncharacterized protein n=2 Tax=Cellulomonas cellasea TaxID=43670 RepID=A0A0A0BAN9_9CELL|nr:hypothetical protein [Cellulomonas cellasea]KGM03192.1 hypothetical protein Q760_09005 [Cellulomonas cellasea DSM 20118]GEA87282.1 hypothetical protein CCE01nite_12310 [Cellulomonas cellasea]
MGFSITSVVAQWGRPLTGLAVNRALDSAEPDESMSWSRPDGWQCYTPQGFYGAGIVPPVRQIADEVGGPVLGLGVESSAHWRVAFMLDGELHGVAAGGSEDGEPEEFEADNVFRWGEDWRMGAAQALAAWVAPFAAVDPAALRAVLTVRHLFAQDTMRDLLRVLTLVPRRNDPYWDAIHESEIPGALYAVDASDLALPDLVRPRDRRPAGDVALVFTRTGVGIWDRRKSDWLREPVHPYDDGLAELPVVLEPYGWRRA